MNEAACGLRHLVDGALRGRLEPEQQKKLWEHVEHCPSCAQALNKGLDQAAEAMIVQAQEDEKSFVPQRATWKQWAVLGSIVIILVVLTVWLAGDMFRYKLAQGPVENLATESGGPIRPLHDVEFLQLAVNGLGEPPPSYAAESLQGASTLTGLAFQVGILSVDQDLAMLRFDALTLNRTHPAFMDLCRRSGAGDVARVLNTQGRIDLNYVGDYGALEQKYSQRGQGGAFRLGRWLRLTQLTSMAGLQPPVKPEFIAADLPRQDMMQQLAALEDELAKDHTSPAALTLLGQVINTSLE